MMAKGKLVWLIGVALVVLQSVTVNVPAEAEPECANQCDDLEIHAQAEHRDHDKTIAVAVLLSNVGKDSLFLFDDTALAGPLELRDGMLKYDISSDMYVRILGAILSPEHVPKTVRYLKLGPGETISRSLEWKAATGAERRIAVRQLRLTVSFTRKLPESEGIDFVKAFGSEPLGCTKEINVPIR